MRVLKQPALNALRGALFLCFEIDLSVGPVSPRAVCAAKLQEGERAALSHPSFLISPFRVRVAIETRQLSGYVGVTHDF